MRLTIPTVLTLVRIALIPVMVVVFYLPYHWTNLVAAAVFALGALTDWLDGWIARRFDMYSAFGAFLDPVADKLAVTVALFIILQAHPTVWMALWAAIIVSREITISALREWMAGIGQGRRMRVVWIGKVKTVVQMIALICLLYRADFAGLPVFKIGEWLLAAAAILTLWSGLLYVQAAWPAMRDDDAA